MQPSLGQIPALLERSSTYTGLLQQLIEKVQQEHS
jgi:hypothetical protein